MKKRKPIVFVLSAPSGTGKTTVCNKILKRDSNIKRVVTVTTRKPRKGEKQGHDYYFVNADRFKRSIRAGMFLEYAEVHNGKYGTPKSGVDTVIAQNKDAMLVIDVQGGLAVRKAIPGAVLIFLKPPTITSLIERLHNRGLDSEKVIQQRMHNALMEMKHAPRYDYIVVNRYVSKAVSNVLRIIKKERKK